VHLHGDAHGAAHAAAHGHDAHAKHDSHGHEDALHGAPHESPAVVTLPLIALAIPSVVIGFITVGPVLFGDFFGNAIQALERNDVIGEMAHEFHGAVAFALHGFGQAPFWLAAAAFRRGCSSTGSLVANSVARKLGWLRTILINNTSSTGSTRTSSPRAPACSAEASGAAATWR
jgi:NADH:ubiquinone oxidoreductase subunit 5 (subunit L)/multisubunit Na+/H+ antiporter MnhA subunit